MCARFALFRWSAEFAALRGFPAQQAPHWNIAPGASVLMLRMDQDDLALAEARWGLTPAWLTDMSRTPAQARAETLTEQPMFRDAFRQRRALVPANGFYEWRGSARKRPYWMSGGGSLLQMAAIWEAYPLEDRVFLSVALVTRAEAGQRRPLLLDGAQRDAWLDPATALPRLQSLLLGPCVALRERALASFVNDPKLDAPECLTPA